MLQRPQSPYLIASVTQFNQATLQVIPKPNRNTPVEPRVGLEVGSHAFDHLRISSKLQPEFKKKWLGL